LRNGTAIDELVARYRQEIPEWGHLPAAMRLKQKLVGGIGVVGAHAVAREALEVPGLDSLHWRPTAGIRQAAERDAFVFRQLWPGGERFTLSPPTTVGVNNNQALVGTSRPGYLACLSDVHVRGRSGVLLARGEALVDIEAWEAGTFEDNPEYDPGILGQTRAGFWTMEPLEPELEVDEAFLLSGAHTIDFGHWITEYLPRYAMARLADMPDVPVLIDERMPPTHRELLELLLPADAEIIVVPHLAVVRVRQLWYAPNPMYIGFYPVRMDDRYWRLIATHAERFARLVAHLDRALRAGAGPREDPASGELGGRRLFLARKPNQKKKLLNHLAVEETVAGHGFEVIYPQDMNFRDQLRAIRDATHVVGPDGSALFLTLFARPGAKLAVLSPPYTLPLVDIAAMLRARGIETTILTGPAVPGADEFSPFWDNYEIEPTGFGAFLRDWLR
jgi:capsular polysaccharide biosynthesis protein